jgi:hypothetical protein
MVGIGSLFVLSRGLSLLAEVVRMLNGWERRESQRRVSLDCFAGWVPLRRSCPTLRAKRRQRCWGRVLSPAGQVSVSVSSRSVGSLGAPKGAPKARQSGLDYVI